MNDAQVDDDGNDGLNRFQKLAILDLSYNPIERISDGTLRPYRSSLRTLRLNGTAIQKPADLPTMTRGILGELSLDFPDFQPTMSFVEGLSNDVKISLLNSRRSHRSVHRLLDQWQHRSAMGMVVRRLRRFAISNPPARPGADDDIPTDGWSTEF